MNKTLFYLLVVLLVACNQSPQQNKETDSSERRATTSFGQSVEKAEDLSDTHDQRNEELEKQAEDLFGDS